MAQPGSFDRYHKWLGIPPREQPPNHYRLLGLGLFEDDRDVIDMVAGRQLEHVRSLALGEHADEAQKLLNELAAARVCLLNPDKKAEYDARLRLSLQPSAPATPLPGPLPTPLARPVAQPMPQAVPVTPRPAWVDEAASHELPSTQTSVRSSRRKRDVQPAARVVSIVIIGAALMVAWWLFKDSQAARPTPEQGTAKQIATADSASSARAAAELQKQLLDLGRPAQPHPKPRTPAADKGLISTSPTNAETQSQGTDRAGPKAPKLARSATGKSARQRINLLKRIDPSRDSVTGDWRLNAAGLMVPPGRAVTLQLPFVPPSAYVLTVEAKPLKQPAAALPGPLVLGLVVAGRQCCLVIRSGPYTGISTVDGKFARDNETTTESVDMEPGKLLTIGCFVNGRHLVAECDGKKFLDWQGDPARLDIDRGYAVPNAGALFIGGNGGMFAITKLEVEIPGHEGPPAAAATTAEPEPEDLAATVASGAELAATKPPPYDPALERRAAEWVLSVGGKIEVAVGGKESVVVDEADMLPDGPLKLIGVDLSELGQVTDADLAKLDGLSQLVRLILGGTGITSEASAQLRAHPLLESLYLEGTSFGDEGIEQITSLTRLRSIDLTDTPTTDAGCESLAEMKSLRRIWLDSTRITDAGVASICKLPLEGIGLEHDRVSDACTAPLLGCPTLQAVLLDDTGVTDAGVAMLLQLPKLSELGLAKTRMTMTSVGALAGAKSLRSLSLSDPPVSRAGHEILKAALPNCDIEWSHQAPTAKASEPAAPASQVAIDEFSWSGGKRVRMEKSAFTFCFFSQIAGALEGYGEGALLALNKDGYSYLSGMSAQSSFAAKAMSVPIAERSHFKLPDREYVWEAGKPPLKLLRKEDGICVLSAVSGKFDGNELVHVYLDDDGYWHLGGSAGFVRGAAMVFACRQHGTHFNVKQYHWKAGMQAVRMIAREQGFCMLSGVGGAFQGGGESVRVKVRDDGYWYLSGRSGQPSLAAEAISITFE